MGNVPFAELREIVGLANVVDAGEALQNLSRDFYWYSPVLKPLLDPKCAEAVVRPATQAEVSGVIAACCRARVSIVVRGAGTGNYGQAVPLYGGVVIDLSRMDRIFSVEGGVARVEAGARLGTIEGVANTAGWELRCMPSTWVKATMGGFLSGGSGGVGSVAWGGIIAPDTVKSLTLFTCEESPRLIRVEEAECKLALHTYGTTGVLVEIEMRLAPKLAYEQLIVASANWDQLLDWSDGVARRPEWRKRLITQFEAPIPRFFKPLAKKIPAGTSATFLLIERRSADDVVRSAEAAGLVCSFRAAWPDPPKPPFITDYTWNHTTLWAMKSDPAFTYLQTGFGPNFREQFAELRRRFPGEILFHLEWMASSLKLAPGHAGIPPVEAMGVGGIPLVHYRSEERLNEILRCCAEIGVYVANPHTFYLEEGGTLPDIAQKRELKSRMDPHGLLNPGKMKTYGYNPFAGGGAP